MTGALAFDVLLCLLLVAVALGAVLARGLFTGVVLFIVLGLFVAIAWVRLGAVDLALAEAAIGAGLTGLLLVRAVGRLRVQRPPRTGAAARAAAALACIALFAVLATIAWTLVPAPGLAPAVQERQSATGLGNPVTAVLLNFRGFDTLLEMMVLVAALLAVWALAPEKAPLGRPGPADHARPRGTLASFARLLPPGGLLVGLHLFWAGAHAPGGAFQAGTILAAVWLLASLGGAASPPPIGSVRLRLLVVAGPALFLAVAAAALPFGQLLVFPPAQAKLLVLLVEAGLTLSIAAILALLVLGPPRAEGPEERKP